MAPLFVVPCGHPTQKRNVARGSQAKALTSHCLADPDLYLSSSGNKPNVKPPLLSVSSESVEKGKPRLACSVSGDFGYKCHIFAMFS